VNQFLTTFEAGQLLQVSDRHVRRLCIAGKLKAKQFGTAKVVWLVDRKSVLAAVKKGSSDGLEAGKHRKKRSALGQDPTVNSRPMHGKSNKSSLEG
jgi:excisionase family DNA binding protein